MRPAPVGVFVATSGIGGTVISIAATEAEAWRLALADVARSAAVQAEDAAQIGHPADMQGAVEEMVLSLAVCRIELTGHMAGPRLWATLAGLLNGWDDALMVQAAAALAELRPDEAGRLHGCVEAQRELAREPRAA